MPLHMHDRVSDNQRRKAPGRPPIALGYNAHVFRGDDSIVACDLVLCPAGAYEQVPERLNPLDCINATRCKHVLNRIIILQWSGLAEILEIPRPACIERLRRGLGAPQNHALLMKGHGSRVVPIGEGVPIFFWGIGSIRLIVGINEILSICMRCIELRDSGKVTAYPFRIIIG